MFGVLPYGYVTLLLLSAGFREGLFGSAGIAFCAGDTSKLLDLLVAPAAADTDDSALSAGDSGDISSDEHGPEI